MNLIRHFRLLATAAAIAVTASLMSAPTARAVEFTASRTILGSDCTKSLKWHGGFPYEGMFADDPARGRVKLCWVKYRLRDRDPDAAYYAVSLQSEWTHVHGERKFPAKMHHAVVSSIRGDRRVFGGTASYTSSSDCLDEVSVSFGVGPIGVSTTPRICDDYGIERYKLGREKALWRSSKAAGLRTIETVYVQKVPQGRVPRFDVVFAIPRYRNWFYEAGGYWKSEERFKWVSWGGR